MTTNSSSTDRNDELLRVALGLNNRVLGLVAGIVSGSGILLATLFLVIRGGEEVGPHLSLLNQFFPGYSVTYGGSVVGLLYGFAAGYLVGWSIAWVYNHLVYLRHG